MRLRSIAAGLAILLLAAGPAVAQDDAAPDVPVDVPGPAPEAPTPESAPLPLAERLRALPGLAAAPEAVREAAVALLTTAAKLATPSGRVPEVPDEELAAALSGLRAARIRQMDGGDDGAGLTMLDAEMDALALLQLRPEELDPTLPEAIEVALARGAPGPGAPGALRTLHLLLRQREIRSSQTAEMLLLAEPPEGDAGEGLRRRWRELQERLRASVREQAAAAAELAPSLDRRNRLLLALDPSLRGARAQREVLDRVVPAGLGAPTDTAQLMAALARLEAIERRLAGRATALAATDGPLAAALASSLESAARDREPYDAAREVDAALWSDIDRYLDDVAGQRAALWKGLAGEDARAGGSEGPLGSALAAALAQRAARAAADVATADADADADGTPGDAGLARAPHAVRAHAAVWLRDALEEIGNADLLERQLDIARSVGSAPSDRGLALLALIEPLDLPWTASVAGRGIDVEIRVAGTRFAMRDLGQLGALPVPRPGEAPTAPTAPSLGALRLAGELLLADPPDVGLVIAALQAAGLPPSEPAPAGPDDQSGAAQNLQ